MRTWNPSWSSRQEPRWYPQRWLRRGLVPPEILCWLLESRSLTDRLRKACGGRFQVRVLDQRWARPMACEVRALGMRPGHYGLVRQVQLLCDGRPWVFARTVMPARTVRGAERRLAHLGTRPLGAILFADPAVRRGAVQVACLAPDQDLFRVAMAGAGLRRPDVIWGRRSVFYVNGKPLLVTEFFLPTVGTCDAGVGKLLNPHIAPRRWRAVQ